MKPYHFLPISAKDAENIYETKSEQIAWCCIENNNKKRTFYNISAIDMYKQKPQDTIHEVIFNCRFFADLDDHDNKYTREEFKKEILKIFSNFHDFFRKYFNLQCESVNFMMSIASYNSAHPRYFFYILCSVGFLYKLC